MNEEFAASVPDDWKKDLRDNILAGMVGSPAEKTKAAVKIGYAYK